MERVVLIDAPIENKYMGRAMPIRLISLLYDTKKNLGHTSNRPPTSIKQYRGNIDLSGHIRIKNGLNLWKNFG